MLDAYRKSRPDASPSDLYIAISTARMIGLGAITIAERKYAQHGAPVYMYIFLTSRTALFLEHSTKSEQRTRLRSRTSSTSFNLPRRTPKPVLSANRHERDGRYPTGKREDRAEHERDVEHVRQNRPSRRKRAA